MHICLIFKILYRCGKKPHKLGKCKAQRVWGSSLSLNYRYFCTVSGRLCHSKKWLTGLKKRMAEKIEMKLEMEMKLC